MHTQFRISSSFSVIKEPITIPSFIISLNLSAFLVETFIDLSTRNLFYPEKQLCANIFEFGSQCRVQLNPPSKSKNNTSLVIIKESISYIVIIQPNINLSAYHSMLITLYSPLVRSIAKQNIIIVLSHQGTHIIFFITSQCH